MKRIIAKKTNEVETPKWTNDIIEVVFETSNAAYREKVRKQILELLKQKQEELASIDSNKLYGSFTEETKEVAKKEIRNKYRTKIKQIETEDRYIESENSHLNVVKTKQEYNEAEKEFKDAKENLREVLVENDLSTFDFSQEIRQIHQERDSRLAELEKMEYSEPLKKKMENEILAQFDAKRSAIERMPWYSAYITKIEKEKSMKQAKKSYEEAQIAHKLYFDIRKPELFWDRNAIIEELQLNHVKVEKLDTWKFYHIDLPEIWFKFDFFIPKYSTGFWTFTGATSRDYSVYMDKDMNLFYEWSDLLQVFDKISNYFKVYWVKIDNPLYAYRIFKIITWLHDSYILKPETDYYQLDLLNCAKDDYELIHISLSELSSGYKFLKEPPQTLKL